MKYKKHIPEGTQDMLFDKCLLKNDIERKFARLFGSYGYAEMETPMLEYYDVFTQGKDSIASEVMYKFTDSKGRLLVLRPDMTVPVARVAGTRLMDNEAAQKPVRVRYAGRVFRFIDAGFGQKDMLQNGIELFGIRSPEADAEVIALAVNALAAAGMDNFVIDIGQVEFFKGLMEAGGFSDFETELIREQIDRKDMIGVEQVLKEHSIDDGLRDTIMNLPNYYGDTDMVRQLEQQGLNSRSRQALEYLEAVIGLLREYGVEKYISIDLGMVQKLNYYTGIIFKGFAEGVGFPVLSGGRYDNLVEKYGSPCPAVGFSVNLDMLMTALDKQCAELPVVRTDFLVGCAEGLQGQAFQLAGSLRTAGKVVVSDIQSSTFGQLKLQAEAREIGTAVYLAEENTVLVFNTSRGTTDTCSVQSLLHDTMLPEVVLPPIH